jgi:tetratricopeptide (TPR) repeat protein
MQLLANTFVFSTFFMIPFLGGNHLPLFFVSIDRFWIDGIFGLILICAVTFSFLRYKYTLSAFFKYLLFFSPLFIVSVASVFYSWNFFNTLLWISILVWSIGSVYLYSTCPDKNTCHAGLIAGAAFASIAAILQLKILFPNLIATFQHGLNAQILREQSGIPFASYMYHNILGGYLAFIFPLALYFGIYRKSLFSLTAAIIIAMGVVITSTRIGLGITLLMYFVTAVILTIEGRKKDLLKVGLVGVISVVAVILILNHGNTKNSVVDARSIIVQKTKAVSADLSTLNTRTDIWKNGYQAFKNSPIIGSGAGSFEYAYRKYFDGNSYTSVAHSTLVKIGVELGLIGLACFLFYLTGISIISFKLLKERRYLFIMLSLVAGFLFSLIDFSFDVKSHVLSFFVISSAFFFSVPRHHNNTTKAKINGKGLAVFLTLIACILANMLFTTRLNESRTSVQNGDMLIEQGLPLKALYSYRDAISAMPLTTEGFTRALSVLLQIYPAESKPDLKAAMAKEMTEYMDLLEGSRDKDSEIYLILGKSHALMKNEKKSDRYFSLALDYYPSSGRYIHEIASYYASQENYDKAMQVIRSFDPFVEKHKGPHNPRGIYVYLIRDLEADIYYKNGDRMQAFNIVHKNCQDAKNAAYVFTSSRTRTFIARNQFMEYLKQKELLYNADLNP